MGTTYVNANTCNKCYEFMPLPKIGKWNKPSANFWAEKICKNSGKRCYKVNYQFNKYGSRVGSDKNNTKHNKHFITFGDSHTFGEGLDYKFTLQHYLEKKINRKILNYSMPGTGPVKLLSLLKFGLTEIKTSGDAVFFIKSYHLSRIDLNTSAFWLSQEPFYVLRNDHKLQYYNNRFKYFGIHHKAMHKLFLFLKKYHLIPATKNYFAYNHEKRTALILKILHEATKLYKERFQGNLYIVFYSDGNLKNNLISNLQKFEPINKIILKRSNYPKNIKLNQICECDTHPNKNYNFELSKQLMPHLEQLNLIN